MVNFTTASQREQLEKLWVESPKNSQRFYQIRTRFYQFFQYCFQALINGEQLQVWQVSHLGQKYWNAYDPVSGCRVNGLSEAEMRAWIEERYHQ
jgi:hypothetical protein